MDYHIYLAQNGKNLLRNDPLDAFINAVQDPPFSETSSQLGVVPTRSYAPWLKLLSRISTLKRSQQTEADWEAEINALWDDLKEYELAINNEVSFLAEKTLLYFSEKELQPMPKGLQYEPVQNIKKFKQDRIEEFKGSLEWEEVETELSVVDEIIEALESLHMEQWTHEQWKVLLGRQEIRYNAIQANFTRRQTGAIKSNIFQLSSFEWNPYETRNYEYYVQFSADQVDALQKQYLELNEARNSLIERESKNAEVEARPVYQKLVHSTREYMKSLRSKITSEAKKKLEEWEQNIWQSKAVTEEFIKELDSYNASEEKWKYETYRILYESKLFYADPLKSIKLMMDQLKQECSSWASTGSSSEIVSMARGFTDRRAELRNEIDELEENETYPEDWTFNLDFVAGGLKILKQDQDRVINEMGNAIVKRAPRNNEASSFSVLSNARESYSYFEAELENIQETHLHKQYMDTLQLLIAEMEVYNEQLFDEVQWDQLHFHYKARLHEVGTVLTKIIDGEMIPITLAQLRFSVCIQDDLMMTWQERRCYNRWPKAPTTDYILKMRRDLVQEIKKHEEEEPAPELEHLLEEADQLLKELDKLWQSQQKMSEWQTIENKFEDEVYRLIPKLSAYDITNEHQAMISSRVVTKSFSLMHLYEAKYGKL